MSAEQTIAKNMLGKRHQTMKTKKATVEALPIKESDRRSKSNDTSNVKDKAKRFDEICKRNEKAWERCITHIDDLAKRPKSPVPPSRFDTVEAGLSVLTFGFDAVRKQSDDTTMKTNETIKDIEAFKEQVTELVDGYVKRIDEAEQKGLEAQVSLRQRERELIEVKGQLHKQEKEIEMLKLMLNEQRKMMEMCMAKYDKQMNRSMSGSLF